MIPCRRFHRSGRERPNTLLSQSLHFSETASRKLELDGFRRPRCGGSKQLEDENCYTLRQVVASI